MLTHSHTTTHTHTPNRKHAHVRAHAKHPSALPSFFGCVVVINIFPRLFPSFLHPFISPLPASIPLSLSLSLILSHTHTRTHMKTHRQTLHAGLAGPLFGRKIVTATRLEFRSQNGTPRAHRQRTNLPRPPACGKFTPPIDVTRTANPHSCLLPATRCTWWYVCTCASAL